jgi:hypothetical protein
MNRFPSKTRTLAEHLVDYENAESGLPETDGRARFAVCEKLRGPLAILSGHNGFRSLLSRALALAGDELHWLRAVHVKADGSLEVPTDMAELDGKEIAESEVVLVSKLLELLVTFIGEPLTLSLLREVWPRAPLKDYMPAPREHEQT